MKSFKTIFYIYQKTVGPEREILCHIFKERKTFPSAYSIRNFSWGYVGHNLVLCTRFVLNANCLLIEYFEELLKCCLLFSLKWKKFQSDRFLNSYILLSLSFCLFSHFQLVGHDFVPLSMQASGRTFFYLTNIWPLICQAWTAWWSCLQNCS